MDILLERWVQVIGIFHNLTREMIITLYDVYKIYMLPIEGLGILRTSSDMQGVMMSPYFGEEWQAINIDHGGIHVDLLYQEGRLSV